MDCITQKTLRRENNRSHNTLALSQCTRMWSVDSSWERHRKQQLAKTTPSFEVGQELKLFPKSPPKQKSTLRRNLRIPHNTRWEYGTTLLVSRPTWRDLTENVPLFVSTQHTLSSIPSTTTLSWSLAKKRSTYYLLMENFLFRCMSPTPLIKKGLVKWGEISNSQIPLPLVYADNHYVVFVT